MTTQASSRSNAPPAQVLDKLLEYLREQLESVVKQGSACESYVAPVVLCILGELLRQAPFRATVWRAASDARHNKTSLVAILAELVRSAVHDTAADASARPQLLYQSLFCLWVLTFDQDVARGIDVHYTLASTLVQAGQAALKHKIVRLVVGIWRNLLANAGEVNTTRLLGAKVLPLCQSLQQRNFADQELEEELQFVVSVLSKRLDQMSSYEEYESELHSGHLSFDNPAHNLEEFWKENAEKLVEDHSKDLKQLVSLVQPDTGSDPATLAVACNDIGKFVHFFEGGRRRADELGAKRAIMALVDSEDAQVRHYALQTLARLVSASWR